MDLRGILKLGLLHMQMIGVWCVNEWSNLYAGQNIQVVELGPGRGTLSDDMLRVGLVICLYLGMVNWTVASSTLYYMYIFFLCVWSWALSCSLYYACSHRHIHNSSICRSGGWRWFHIVSVFSILVIYSLSSLINCSFTLVSKTSLLWW